MGTRASFWIGDPRKIKNRKWIGCIKWDGEPDGNIEVLKEAKTEDEFIDIINNIYSNRDDFAHPDKGWPYPWDDDIFLTDYTCAFFDNEIKIAYFHRGFFPFSEIFKIDGEDNLPDNIPAPMPYNSEQPGSILLMAWNPDKRVATARDIGRQFGFDQVIIIGLDNQRNIMTSASFGETKKLDDECKILEETVYDAVFEKINKIR